MGSSFSRIANEPFEDIPEPLGPLEIDSGIANKLRDLVRGAHEQKLASLQRARTDARPSIFRWVRTWTIDVFSRPSPTEESTPIILARALLYEKLQYFLTLPSTWGNIISLGPNDAGAVLDLLQEWLDWAPVDHSHRRRGIYLLVKLSIGSQQLPRLLYVSNVQIGNRDPWDGGGFSDVFKAMHDNKLVVLKRLRVYRTQKSNPDWDQSFRHEALIWRQLKHPFILPLIGIDAITFAETHRLPCLVSPLMQRGTLKEFIHSADYVPMRDFYRLLEEAAEGVTYLHSQKVIHGDIKDVNILVNDECSVQLCDFGLVVVGNTTEGHLPTSHGAQGTVTWMSPQRLGGTLHRRTEADDVYALACLCYYLSTDGHAPFHNLPQPAALIQIVNLAQRPSRPTDGETSRTLVTDALWAMVESCWAQDASIRPTAAGVVSQLAVIGPAAVAAASPKGSRVFDARKALRAAVLAIMAIERMSRLLDDRAWIPQSKASDREHSPDASHTVEPPVLGEEGLGGRNDGLPAKDYVLSQDLVQRLDTLIRDNGAVQTAVDILDIALLNSNPSHPAYGQAVRRLRSWCSKFALLPTSCVPISIRNIQLQSEQPRYISAGSDVFLGLYNGSRVAVKVIRAFMSERSLDDDQKSFRNEVVTLRYLRHPNIVPFLGVCDKSPLCLVSHWMEEGTLLEFFQRHPREHRTSYILGTIRGLAFMHSLGLVHGTIKSLNILVDREHRARLSGFGLVSVLNTATTTIHDVSGGGGQGTLRYMAPELFDAMAARTDRSDVYALSITIWEVFVLEMPFYHIRDNVALALRVLKGERPTKPIGCENIGFTDDLWDMMQRGWSAKPESRPSLSAFVEMLQSQDY